MKYCRGQSRRRGWRRSSQRCVPGWRKGPFRKIGPALRTPSKPQRRQTFFFKKRGVSPVGVVEGSKIHAHRTKRSLRTPCQRWKFPRAGDAKASFPLHGRPRRTERRFDHRPRRGCAVKKGNHVRVSDLLNSLEDHRKTHELSPDRLFFGRACGRQLGAQAEDGGRVRVEVRLHLLEVAQSRCCRQLANTKGRSSPDVRLTALDDAGEV